jgi:hypothetical protein
MAASKGGVALGCHGSDTNGDTVASAARKDASRANSSFKMDAEEIIAVIVYVRLRKQHIKKKKKLLVHPFVADRPTSGMFCKIFSDL